MKKKEIYNKIVAENRENRYPDQCPECGYRNLRVRRGKRVDFYGVPYFLTCDCGWKIEIVVIEEVLP